jgi:hypothetical protein
VVYEGRPWHSLMAGALAKPFRSENLARAVQAAMPARAPEPPGHH